LYKIVEVSTGEDFLKGYRMSKSKIEITKGEPDIA